MRKELMSRMYKLKNGLLIDVFQIEYIFLNPELNTASIALKGEVNIGIPLDEYNRITDHLKEHCTMIMIAYKFKSTNEN